MVGREAITRPIWRYMTAVKEVNEAEMKRQLQEIPPLWWPFLTAVYPPQLMEPIDITRPPVSNVRLAVVVEQSKIDNANNARVELGFPELEIPEWFMVTP